MRTVFSCILLLTGLFIAAQTDELDKHDGNNPLVFMQQLQQINTDASQLNSGQTNSRVTSITQIGNGNSITSRTASEVASLNYVQIGDTNNIESYSNIQRTSEQILQRGTNNEVLNYNFGSVTNSSLKLIQSGTNLSFQKYGTNAQTENLAFRLTGADRTVIIRSY